MTREQLQPHREQQLSELRRNALKTPEQLHSWGFSSGYFRDVKPAIDGSRSNIPPRSFSPAEQVVISEIRRRLSHQPQVRVLGIGEMLASSFVHIAKTFEREVKNQRLQMIATNLDPQFTIGNGIAEARRRLNLISMQEWLDLYQYSHARDHMEWFHHLHPLLSSTEEIDFLAQHQHLITYASGIDTLAIPNLIAKGEKIDVTHESMAGLFFHEKLDTAVPAIVGLMQPSGGILLTTTDLSSMLTPGRFPVKLDQRVSEEGRQKGYSLYRRY